MRGKSRMDNSETQTALNTTDKDKQNNTYN